MAARQASQSNAMLYTLITFIALFIIATVFAVVYYVKSEEYRTQAEVNLKDRQEVASDSEKRNLAKIVGKTKEGKTYLGTLQDVCDELYQFILGQLPPENQPVTVKFNEIALKIDALNRDVLKQDKDEEGEKVSTTAYGKDGVGMLNTIRNLKLDLDAAQENNMGLVQQIGDMEIDLDDAVDRHEEEKESLLAELNEFQALIDEIRQSFDALKETMDEETARTVASFEQKLDKIQETLKDRQVVLDNTEKELARISKELQSAQEKIRDIQQPPKNDLQAFQPDVRIMSIDARNGIVFLDAGVKDHIYRGLTFAVYDRNKPIPENGEGKAELEVFQADEYACAARVIKSDTRNPIVEDDIVANLIWDRNTPKRFVVAGEFDYNQDGRVEPDGDQRIIELVERWGGRIMDDVSVETDFLVIGHEPRTLRRPTPDELDIDPAAQQRYEKSLQKAEAYKKTLERAGALGIPVFNQNRFLFLIGYDTMATKNR